MRKTLSHVRRHGGTAGRLIMKAHDEYRKRRDKLKSRYDHNGGKITKEMYNEFKTLNNFSRIQFPVWPEEMITAFNEYGGQFNETR